MFFVSIGLAACGTAMPDHTCQIISGRLAARYSAMIWLNSGDDTFFSFPFLAYRSLGRVLEMEAIFVCIYL